MWWLDAGFLLLMVALLIVAFSLGTMQEGSLNPVDAYCHGAAEGTAAFYFDNYGQMPNLDLRTDYEAECKKAVLAGTWLVMDLEGPILPKK